MDAKRDRSFRKSAVHVLVISSLAAVLAGLAGGWARSQPRHHRPFGEAWCLLFGLFSYPLGGREKKTERRKRRRHIWLLQWVRPQLSKALTRSFLLLCLSCPKFQGALGGILGNVRGLSSCVGSILALLF